MICMSVHSSSLQLCPEDSEEFVEYLSSIGRLDEAAVKMMEILNNVKQLAFLELSSKV